MTWETCPISLLNLPEKSVFFYWIPMGDCSPAYLLPLLCTCWIFFEVCACAYQCWENHQKYTNRLNPLTVYSTGAPLFLLFPQNCFNGAWLGGIWILYTVLCNSFSFRLNTQTLLPSIYRMVKETALQVSWSWHIMTCFTNMQLLC